MRWATHAPTTMPPRTLRQSSAKAAAPQDHLPADPTALPTLSATGMLEWARHCDARTGSLHQSRWRAAGRIQESLGNGRHVSARVQPAPDPGCTASRTGLFAVAVSDWDGDSNRDLTTVPASEARWGTQPGSVTGPMIPSQSNSTPS